MKIAYLDAQSYAGGTANSVRVNAMLEALALGGHEVVLYREQTGGNHQRPAWLGSKPANWVVPNAALLGTAVEAWLDGLTMTPDLVLCYGVDPRYLVRIQRWCRRHRLPLVVDVVDWYASEDVTGLGPKLFCLINDQWVMRSVVARCAGAIVASRLLEQHFAGLRVPALRIPAVIAGLPAALPTRPNGLTMTYAGAPGRRESKAVENLRRLAREGELIRLGITLKVVGLSVPPDSDPITECDIAYLGRLPRDDTLELVAKSTFTVLQRPPDRRFAQAGFPSKVAESLLLGVPVVTNLTSDLSQFLVDRQNSVVLASDGYEALRQGVARAAEWAASVNNDAIALQAADQFSPGAIEARLSAFLTSVVRNGSNG